MRMRIRRTAGRFCIEASEVLNAGRLCLDKISRNAVIWFIAGEKFFRMIFASFPQLRPQAEVLLIKLEILSRFQEDVLELAYVYAYYSKLLKQQMTMEGRRPFKEMIFRYSAPGFNCRKNFFRSWPPAVVFSVNLDTLSKLNDGKSSGNSRIHARIYTARC